MHQKQSRLILLTGILCGLFSCRQDVADLLFDKKIITPTIPRVINVTASNNDGTFATGSPIHIQVVFNTDVIVTGTPQIILSTGNPVTTNVNYVSGSGGQTLTFDYTVIATNSSSDLDYASTGALILNGGTIIGKNGFTAELGLASPGAQNSLGYNKNIVIDPNAAKVTGVNAPGTPDNTYTAGTVINIQVTFDNAVVVSGGTPRIPMDVVTPNTYAVYTGGSPSAVLTFSYTVATGNSTADLRYVAGAAIDLNGATIVKQSNSTTADVSLPQEGSGNSLGDNKNIVIDAILPSVTSVSSTTSNGSYGPGSVVSIQVTFSKTINSSSGTRELTLNAGGGAVATYASGTPGTTLTFTYTVGAIGSGQTTSDLDSASTGALTGTYLDSTGNAAALGLPAIGGASSISGPKTIVIDTTRPTVVSMSNPGSSSVSTLLGATIYLDVNFSENVLVAAGAELSLSTGDTATYYSGSGTSTIRFRYVIPAGTTSSRLDYAATTSLTALPTIRDSASNDATLTLPATGAGSYLYALNIQLNLL